MASSDREWIVDEIAEDGQVNREAVIASLMEAEAIGHRVGMALTAMPIRINENRGNAQIGGGEDEIVTLGWRFKLSRVPLAKRREVPPAPDESVSLYEAPEIAEEEPEAETLGEGDALEAARNGG